MKTKTGMSIGLALTLMVGVFATMLALGLFTYYRGAEPTTTPWTVTLPRRTITLLQRRRSQTTLAGADVQVTVGFTLGNFKTPMP